jgi:hypothetical protein
VPSTGSSRALIIKWLEDTGIVHQLLNFITLSPIVSTGSAEDTSSCCRLVDAIDSAPLPPVSLLELAHAQPLQVARALFLPITALTTTKATFTDIRSLTLAFCRSWATSQRFSRVY